MNILRFRIRTLLSLLLIASATLYLTILLCNIFDRLEIGRQFGEQLFETSDYVIRIRAYHEYGTFLAAAGGFYEYEIRNNTSEIWRRIALFRLPLPEEIPADQVGQLADGTVFFFQGYVFGISTDGGSSWLIKGGDYPPLANGVLEQYAYIDTLDIRPSGIGFMILSNFDPETRRKRPSIILETSDFGLNWALRN